MKPNTDSRRGCYVAVVVTVTGLQGGAMRGGCAPGFLSESVSEEKPWMGSYVAQILSVPWNRKQQH